jgi:hypothetical protein
MRDPIDYMDTIFIHILIGLPRAMHGVCVLYIIRFPWRLRCPVQDSIAKLELPPRVNEAGVIARLARLQAGLASDNGPLSYKSYVWGLSLPLLLHL